MSLGRAGQAEQPQHGHEVRVGPVVEDHEAGVGGVAAPEDVKGDRVRVPAGVAVGLEHVDVVVAVEKAGRQQPADAGPDDGDSHGWRLRRPARRRHQPRPGHTTPGAPGTRAPGRGRNMPPAPPGGAEGNWPGRLR